jgi:hypothetical protein
MRSSGKNNLDLIITAYSLRKITLTDNNKERDEGLKNISIQNQEQP